MTSTPIPTTTPTTTPTRGAPPALLFAPVPVSAVPCAPAVFVFVVDADTDADAERTHPTVSRCAALKQLPSAPRTTLKLTTDSYPPASVRVSERPVPPHAFAVQSREVFRSAVQDESGTELGGCVRRRV